MPRVVHFEIPATDPAAGVAFYEKVFGWKFQKWDGPVEYWLVTTGDEKDMGIDGGLMRRQAPEQVVVNTIGVSSVDEYVDRVKAAGGTIVMDKMAVPTVGWLAYFKDPDGNIFGIMQPDEAAG